MCMCMYMFFTCFLLFYVLRYGVYTATVAIGYTVVIICTSDGVDCKTACMYKGI